MTTLRLALLSVILLSGAAHAEEPFVAPASCPKDFEAMEASFVETQERLEKDFKGDKATKCAAIAHHIDVMKTAIDTFNRCLPEGFEQRENVGQLAVSIEDFLY